MKPAAVIIPPMRPVPVGTNSAERRAIFATTGAALATANPKAAEFVTQKTLRALSSGVALPNFSIPRP